MFCSGWQIALTLAHKVLYIRNCSDTNVQLRQWGNLDLVVLSSNVMVLCHATTQTVLGIA